MFCPHGRMLLDGWMNFSHLKKILLMLVVPSRGSPFFPQESVCVCWRERDRDEDGQVGFQVHTVVTGRHTNTLVRSVEVTRSYIYKKNFIVLLLSLLFPFVVVIVVIIIKIVERRL